MAVRVYHHEGGATKKRVGMIRRSSMCGVAPPIHISSADESSEEFIKTPASASADPVHRKDSGLAGVYP